MLLFGSAILWLLSVAWGQSASGALSETYKDHLESWIQDGPKTFTLLYKISTDGCDAKIFHQKCDNKGPTVTVVYDVKGSVFGGYTSKSWEHKFVQPQQHFISDTSSFLYQLKLFGKTDRRKFMVKHHNRAILTGLFLGPAFGEYDLQTFSYSCDKVDGVFDLGAYGSFDFGKRFTASSTDTNPSRSYSKKLVDIEVYAVTDGARQKVTELIWRKPPKWNAQSKADLLAEISSLAPPVGMDARWFNVLLVGPVESGKSSFCNTVGSVFKGRVSHKALVGGATNRSSTSVFTPYTFTGPNGSSVPFRLLDTPGFTADGSVDLLQMNFVLDGHVPLYYEFNPTGLINNITPGFIKEPTLSHKSHVVALVLDALTLMDTSDVMLKKLLNLQDILVRKQIPYAVLLTKIDKVSPAVEENIQSVFHSMEIQTLVYKVSDLFKIPRSNVLLVKNYEQEMDLDDNVNILAMVATRQMLYLAEDYLDSLHVKQRQPSTESIAATESHQTSRKPAVTGKSDKTEF